jgi:hypothetical protein
MSAEHKSALAEGREQGRAVRRYLEALDAQKPRRGRPRNEESMRARLSAIEAQLEGADPLKRLHLTQERLDLTAALNEAAATTDMEALEADFVRAAANYGQRKSISYSTWRQVGVPTGVLNKAGIGRS